MLPLPTTAVACFGEILWDILPAGRRVGGAPFNVCYHLGQLGVPAAMVSRIADDENGNGIQILLHDMQLNTAYVQVKGEKPTGYVFGTEVAPNEMQYDIVENVAWDDIAVTPANLQLVAEAPYFIFGSLAARSVTSRETLFALLEKSTCTVFDINLRRPYYSEDLIVALLGKTSILKINEAELDILASWFGYAGTTLEKLDALAQQYTLSEILLTRGGDGAMVYLDGICYSVNGIHTQVADTVGSGDAFLAGYLYARMQGAAMEQRLETANQLAAWVTRSYGGCPPYDNLIKEHIYQTLTKKPALP